MLRRSTLVTQTCELKKVILLVERVFVLDTTAILRDHEQRHDTGPVVSGNIMIRLRDLLKEETSKKETPYVSGDTYIGKEEAMRVYKNMGYNFDPNEFYMGMNVELEHQDITDGSLVKTAMVAAAHLREIPNYYTLLKKYVENAQ